jgi:hypothetical protein
MVGSELIDPLTDQQLEHISDNYGPASFFSTAAVGILLLEILLSLVGLGLGSRTDRWIAAIFGSACGALLFGVVWNDEALSTRVEKVTHLRVVSVAERFGLR